MTFRLITLCLLVGTMLASSVALVYVQHLRRDLFTQFKALEKNRDHLDVEWGRPQLESSTWAAQARIEQVAIDKLQFQVPVATSIVLVRP